MASVFEFLESEIRNMENVFKATGGKPPGREFCHRVAQSFSYTVRRAGKPLVYADQVQNWFEKKQEELEALVPCSPGFKEFIVPKNTSTSSSAPENCQISEDITELLFEAKSSKDDAWYDVGSFLRHRVLSTGEREVRVRFAGFGSEEDEWVNVEKGVRERSIPLEASECHRVKVGDLVLCFREDDDEAIYCDAHVVEIQQRLHDITGCTCHFVVRFDHDNVEETVNLKRICCRPTQ